MFALLRRLPAGPVLLLALCVFSALGQEDTEAVPFDLVETNIIMSDASYLVEYTGEPGTPEGAQGAQTFFTEMATAQIPFTIRYNYTTLLNGAEILLDPQYYGAIRLKGGAGTISAVRARRRAVTSNTSIVRDGQALPMLQHKYTGVDQVHAAGKYTGAGVKVGIIDTGLDHRHPAFGSCYKAAGCRVAYGYDFAGDAYNGTNLPVPDDDPLDTCNGHGTHVAGILAGDDGVFQGVAPKATIGAYRIFGCEGYATESIIIQALERAYTDGMNVINMSLSLDGTWDDHLYTGIGNRLVQKGVMVVAGAGNAGSGGLGLLGAPAGTSGVIAVASAILPELYGLAFNVTYPSTDGTNTTLTMMRSEVVESFIGTNVTDVPLVRGLNANGTDFMCSPIVNDVRGKVVLMQSDDCYYSDAAKLALEAGASFLIVYYTKDSLITGITYFEEVNLPSMVITLGDGERLLGILNSTAAGSVLFSLGAERGAFQYPFTSGIDYYSSWGPTAHALMKPDVTAPGGEIYSTYPLDMGGYMSMSGTSMATPYAAGVVALLIESGMSVASGQVYSALVHTATPYLDPDTGLPVPPVLQGTGLLNATAALLATMQPSVRSFSFKHLDDALPAFKSPDCLDWTVTHNGPSSGDYRVEYIPALSALAFDANGTAANPPDMTDTYLPMGSVTPATFSGSSANASTSFKLAFDRQALASNDLMVYNGYVRFFPASGSGLNYTISAGGLNFPSSKIPILPPPDQGLPCLVDAATGLCIDAGKSFTMLGNDTPAFALSLQAPVYRITLQVTQMAGGGPSPSGANNATTPTSESASLPSPSSSTTGQDFFLPEHDTRFLSKNDPQGYYPYYTYVWDGRVLGTASPRPVPAVAGDYAFKLSFYRMSLDETPLEWISPGFTIQPVVTTSS
ncbi:hypothetical protein IWQ60_011348 [Tieghemiomyces parasiticus]|uniref:Subtilisin n=1 Tax=Tieghemiomyces parasiticus TaxID=78921 RepID=A0A9W7ZNG9_9FUNG|nr:hypothetical protein IWQ60_011348 [Tieghemiomyces parasiticus]